MIFLSAGVMLTACSDDDDDEPTPTNNNNNNSGDPSIAEIVINSNDHDSLEKAVLRFPDLAATLSGSGSFTVFAPTNAAFAALGSAVADIDSTALRNILLYHVIGAEVRSTSLADYTYANTLSQGPNMELLSLKADVTGGATINNTANITTVDLDASNGVVHVVDEVLTQQSIVDFATKDDRFDSLVVALTAYPSFTFVGTLSGSGPFTVFAPTNTAFVNLLSDLGATRVSDIPETTLAAVLSYHVVNGANVQSDELSQGQNITTLGGTLTVDLTNGAQLMTSDTSQAAVDIIITDVQGTNGVIHAVDEVLLP
ncbi:MAG: cell adhesion protein [Flavobacteriales bacterium]|nr:cell adhesion protein [Flavobacteriales bacterium]